MNALTLVHNLQHPSAMIDREPLLEALGIMTGVAEKRSTIPILNNILIIRTPDEERCVTLRASDLDMQIEVNVRAAVNEDFATTVPAHTIQDIVKRVPDAEFQRLSLELLPAPAQRKQVLDADSEPVLDGDGQPKYEEVRSNRFVSDKVRVRLGRATFDLATEDPEGFPELAPFKSVPHMLTLPGSAFWNALDAVMAAISTEETRYYLNGVYFHIVGPQTLAMTATDGHKLFRQEIGEVAGLPADMRGVIIPRMAVQLLHKQLRGKACPPDVEIYLDDERFAVNWGPVAFVTKVIDGTFPDYARVIPANNDKVAVMNTPRLVKSIGAITALSSDRGRSVKCRFEANLLTLTVSDAGTGTGSIDMTCEYDAEPIEIGFNAGYLTDVLQRAAPDNANVTIKMADPQSPALVTGSLAGWTGVVMPTRV